MACRKKLISSVSRNSVRSRCLVELEDNLHLSLAMINAVLVAVDIGDVITGVREAAGHHVLNRHALALLDEEDVDREGCIVRDRWSEEHGVEEDLVSSLSEVVETQQLVVAWYHSLSCAIPGCGVLELEYGGLPSVKWWVGNLHQKEVGELN